MPDWQMQTITDETMPRLPESKYHRMGGWLLFLVLLIALQGIGRFVTFLLLAAGLLSHNGELTGGIALLFALCLFPVLLLAATFALLFRRKAAFRVPLAVYTLLQFIGALISTIRSSGYDWVSNGFLALLYAAWIVYFFTSDRVRVYCNKRPKRPVPMPVPEEAMARWDASGQIYTDEDGVVTDFSKAPASALPYHFINMPSGWRMTARRTQQQEE